MARTDLPQPTFLQTYFLYLVAGAATLPAALLYAALSASGITRPGAVIPVFAVGVLLAHLGWRFAEKRWVYREDGAIVVPAAQSSGTVTQAFMTDGVAMASWIGVLIFVLLFMRWFIPPQPIRF